jgi:NADPH:quinone reductase-like Zn-dependent oxidoreductase
MKALVLESYNTNLIRAMRSMKVVEKDSPKLLKGEVLIKIQAAPINPSDIAFLRGGYNITKTLPAIPGFEGTGLIAAVGNDIDEKLIGKRVSFFSQEDEGGTWAEFVTVKLQGCLFVSDELPVGQAACLFVNPLTAYALFDHVVTNGHNAIIQSAAMGQVGKFIRFFAKEKGIKMINLVRKAEHTDELRNQGEEFVLNLNDEDFEGSLAGISAKLGATAAIDAVGGELSGKILNAMPTGSEVILYGGLSGLPVGQIDALEIIFNNKILGGFNLGNWLEDLPGRELTEISNKLQNLFIQGKIETKIQGSVPLNEFYDGLKSYISDMSGGKVLFSMSDC